MWEMEFDNWIKCFNAFEQLGTRSGIQRPSLRKAQMLHFHYFGTLMSLPTLHSLLFSNPRLIFDPISQLGNAGVNPWLVPTGAALAPTHDAGLEPLPALLKAHQGSSRVTLVITVRVSHWDWMWKTVPALTVSPGMRQPLRLRIRCRASWRWPGPPWPRYTRCRWWSSPTPSAAAVPFDLQERDRWVNAQWCDLGVHHQHQRC